MARNSYSAHERKLKNENIFVTGKDNERAIKSVIKTISAAKAAEQLTLIWIHIAGNW